MTWADYLIRHAGDETGREIATKLGVTESNVSRWKKGGHTPDVNYVVLFARTYGRPVLEALVEAEVITPAEAKARPTLAPDFDQLTDDGMVFRYRDADGLEGGEGAFTTCTFWYVECLARAGRLHEAREIMARGVHYANHLGLFAEELSLRAEPLGNFPQALTHLAFVSAAYYLDRQLSDPDGRVWQP